MALKKLEVVLDADDVLLDCNSYALRLLSEEEHYYYRLSDITGWGVLGKDVDRRMKFFEDKKFFENQPALPGAKDFLYELMEKVNVTIMTAVNPDFMGERINRIKKLFPEFPLDHIVMGSRKDMVHADVMLDDGIHNLISSGCKVPVLFRQPWNRNVSGICGVSSYNEFMTLIDFMNGQKKNLSRIPKIICLVGPSGSDKNRLADELCQKIDYERVYTCTTARIKKGNGMNFNKNYFELCKQKGDFLETTYYGNEQYGVRIEDIDKILKKGKNAVTVMDISGCISVYNRYPGQCVIFFVDRDKRDCILSIIQKPGLNRDQIADRIIAIDLEEKNKVLADHVIRMRTGSDLTNEVDAIVSAVYDAHLG